MGDHHRNPNALLNKAAPPAPMGKQPRVEITPIKVLKPHVLQVAEDRVREVDGRLEILGRHQTVVGGELVTPEVDTWGPPARGVKVVRIGDQLTNADFDIVHMLQSVLIDTRLVNASGEAPATVVNLTEFHRMDFLEWVEAHESVKRGAGG